MKYETRQNAAERPDTEFFLMTESKRQKLNSCFLLAAPSPQQRHPQTPTHTTPLRKAEEMAGPVLIRETKGQGGREERIGGGGGDLRSVWKLEGQN